MGSVLMALSFANITQKIKSSINDLDLSVFKKDLPVCTGSDFLACPAMIRLTVALKYYSLLREENDKETFISFIEEVYSQNVLNDNNHLILCHNEQLQQINERIFGASKCSIATCQFTARHFDSSSIAAINEKGDEMMNFYVSIFDSLHFWFYHCFDGGFRVKASSKEQEKNENDQNGDNALFDAEFARVNDVVRMTDFETKPFERISDGNNSKFTICIDSEQRDLTFMDELYQAIDSKVVREKLKNFIKREVFDTDTVKMDVESEKYGNISSLFPECTQSILQFIKEVNVNELTFALGLRFYYWDYYKDKEELPAKQQMIGDVDNKHNHSGYKVCELYVNKKYDSLQEDVRNYPHFDIRKYNKAKIKAFKYLKTEKIKKTKAKWTYHDTLYGYDILLKYEI